MLRKIREMPGSDHEAAKLWPFLPRTRIGKYASSVMPLLALGLVLVILLAGIALMPLTLVQRYRAGTARRPARGWLATINVTGIGISIALFVAGAAVTSIWVPQAFTFTLSGLTGGCLLGLLGLALTRWDVTSRGLHYTPNRLLVLAITLVVTARLLYGFWRGLHTWRLAGGDTSWLVTAGIPGSLAAGAVVLGYYFVYWTGVLWRFRRHRAATSDP